MTKNTFPKTKCHPPDKCFAAFGLADALLPPQLCIGNGVIGHFNLVYVAPPMFNLGVGRGVVWRAQCSKNLVWRLILVWGIVSLVISTLFEVVPLMFT